MCYLKVCDIAVRLMPGVQLRSGQVLQVRRSDLRLLLPQAGSRQPRRAQRRLRRRQGRLCRWG